MTRTFRLTALALFVAAEAASAGEPAGPPAWNDKASVYLTMSQAAAESANSQSPAASSEVEVASPPSAAANVETAPILNPPVVPATYEAPAESAPPPTGSRYLAPPSAELESVNDGTSIDRSRQANSASRRLAEFELPMSSMYTVLSALAIVIGAFLLFVWVFKRGNRGSAGRRRALPADVVSVLGRVPLTARQFAELLRVGNKLVLVSLTPTGAETLTEVTDPAEVDRLVGLCQQSNPYSTTKAFEQVFQQMSNQTAPSSFLGNEPLMPPLASPIATYRSNRGGVTRG
jgi:flagellar biogenesis protein FliO